MIEEAISRSERLKRRLRMKRNKIKLKYARKMAAHRTPSYKTLQRRARNSARRALQKKFLGKRSKGNLSPSMKSSIERRISSRPQTLKSLTRKYLPIARKRARLRKK